jgi:hypothetical protein
MEIWEERLAREERAQRKVAGRAAADETEEEIREHLRAFRARMGWSDEKWLQFLQERCANSASEAAASQMVQAKGDLEDKRLHDKVDELAAEWRKRCAQAQFYARTKE